MYLGHQPTTTNSSNKASRPTRRRQFLLGVRTQEHETESNHLVRITHRANCFELTTFWMQLRETEAIVHDLHCCFSFFEKQIVY